MPLPKHEIQRAEKLIRQVIAKLSIDLSGINVLTEVGSNYFVFTPVIAAMANANKIYAWTRDSSFGKAAGIIDECRAVFKAMGLDTSIEFAANERPAAHAADAHIITNLGFVRPLSVELLKDARKGAVIAAMCEAWEVREEDIAIDVCKAKSIKVAGTWENHPALKIFDGCGPLAIKMCHEAGYEVYQNNIIIWSDDHFGDVIEEAFVRYCAAKVVRTTDVDVVMENIEGCDFIFFCKQNEKREILGPSGLIDIKKIIEKNPAAGIVHLYGRVDAEYLQSLGVNVFPARSGRATVMTRTLAHLGMKPLIDLHAAGLKVGEQLYRGTMNELSQPIV